jgi:hypothetical protein
MVTTIFISGSPLAGLLRCILISRCVPSASGSEGISRFPLLYPTARAHLLQTILADRADLLALSLAATVHKNRVTDLLGISGNKSLCRMVPESHEVQRLP